MIDFRRRRFAPSESKVKILLAAGFLTHLLAAILVFLIGKTESFPRFLLPTGILAGDAASYIAECSALSQTLAAGDFSFLFSGGEQLHIRLYTISYALLSPLVGENILAFELVNLPLALANLYLVYRLGKLCFSARVGFGAGLAVNFLPSFQLHAAQPLRDPLFVFLFLGFFFNLALVLVEPHDVRRAARRLLVTAFVFFLPLWLVRNGMFFVYLAITGIVLFLLPAARRKNLRAFKYNVAVICLIAVFVFVTPRVFSGWMPERIYYSVQMYEKIEAFKKESREAGQPRPLAYLNAFRYEFNAVYEEAGSNIDAGVYFATLTEFALYLPRAAAIGAFAPFPDLWVSEGKSFGRTGRTVAGIETLLIYVLAAFALVGSYRNRHSAQLWLIVLSFGAGATALGLVVTNLGALYRMRYFFWFLLILVGVEGITRVLGKSESPAAGSEDSPAATSQA